MDRGNRQCFSIDQRSVIRSARDISARPAHNSLNRPAIPFRSVNRRDQPGFREGYQRHHLLSLQLLNNSCFSGMFTKLGSVLFDFDDFRSNGILLPCTSAGSIQTGLPLHRGPHRQYSDVVYARVEPIATEWQRASFQSETVAAAVAARSLGLLQTALRQRLMRAPNGRPIFLNSKDPVGTGFDFRELDAMADLFWQATSPEAS